MTREFAVKGELQNGQIRTIERGFPTHEEAEDYPVRLSEWCRVWVEAIVEAGPQRERAKPGPKRNNRLAWANAAFGEIEAAAIVGARCPVRGTGHVTGSTARELARQGRIRIDVYGQNWRVVTILVGPHRGKHTALPPNGGAPHLTIHREAAA